MTRKKITSGKFIDLAKLIPRDVVKLQPDSTKLHMINQDGLPTFVPASEKEGIAISNFHKWEQAFHVYSTIYVQAHPHKAKELMQYTHTIFTASLTYVWDNVHAYDIDFLSGPIAVRE